MNQFAVFPLEYNVRLRDYYHQLSHLPGFVLLESTDQIRGRYDIISAYPYDHYTINQNDRNIESSLIELKNILSVQPSVNDLPFQGGAIGYISYDLGAKRFGITAQPQPTLKDMPLLDFGLYDWAIIADHHQRTINLFAANTHHSTPEIVDKVLELWHNTELKEKDVCLKSDFIPIILKKEYQNAFDSIFNYLKEGRSYQVNYTQPFIAYYEGDSWQFYKKISMNNSVPFAAFLRTDNADILSFSPERFIFHEQRQLSTSPIKGTVRSSMNSVEDELLKHQLSACEKNRAENVMIVDLLRNDLGKVAETGSVQVTKLCEVQSYKSVHHLVSTIEAHRLESIHPFEVFLSCFPGGSITGAPKIESMKIINEQELYGRGVYCGSIGYFSRHGRFDTNISIRTITAKDNILHLAAGGGIVIYSDWEDEYRECYIKIEAIINGLK